MTPEQEIKYHEARRNAIKNILETIIIDQARSGSGRKVEMEALRIDLAIQKFDWNYTDEQNKAEEQK